MKKVFLLLTAGVTGFTVSHAQLKQGTIYYDQKVNMHRNLPEEMKSMVAEFRTSKYQLEFSDSISLYKLVPADEAPDPFAGGGGRTMVFTMGGGGQGDMYKNFSQKKSVQATEVAGKNFLVTDSVRPIPWKLATETKQILGYTCHKATRKIMMPSPQIRRMVMNGGATPSSDTTTTKKSAPREAEVVAWYADDIVSPAGPENYGQLPGVILELDVDNGQTVYTATEVKKTVDTKNLKEPKKGKVVTQQEFVQIMKDMMGAGMSSGGGVIRFGSN